jgi:energy-converting hydrogenase Eha subunit G
MLILFQQAIVTQIAYVLVDIVVISARRGHLSAIAVMNMISFACFVIIAHDTPALLATVETVL